MDANRQTLEQALAHQQAGRLELAATLLRTLLEREPDHADALHLLGIVLHQQKHYELARETLERAVALAPHEAQRHNSLAIVLKQLGGTEEALARFRRALELQPDLVDAHANLGRALRERGDRSGAAACFRRVLELRPELAPALLQVQELLLELGQLEEVVALGQRFLPRQPTNGGGWSNLAHAWQQLGKFDEAVRSYRQALLVQPDLVDAFNNLGVLFASRQQRDEAIACYRHAIHLKPTFAEAFNNLGTVFEIQGQLDLAASCYQTAMQLKPGSFEALTNLGTIRLKQVRLEEAEQLYRQAVQRFPERPAAHSLLGSCLAAQERNAEAEACYRHSLQLDPGHGDGHLLLGLLQLLKGQFESGWEEYEWRYQTTSCPPRRFPQPAWQGESLEGKTILLHAEQGLGDTLHCVRYVSLVQQRGARVVLEAQVVLVPLLQRSPGFDQLVPHGKPLPPFDVHASLLSLPRLCGTRRDNIPAQVPYVFADPERSSQWQQRLQPLNGLRVGLCWRGNPRHPLDRYRSLALAQFARLAQIPGVHWISLQKGSGVDEWPETSFPFERLGDDWDLDGAFVDGPALVSQLDLVITCDTSMAHLAGALGVPVWVLLQYGPDWRWLLEGESSPWYPSMRLFRQRQVGDWEPVLDDVAAALGARAAERGACAASQATKTLPEEAKALVQTETLRLKQCRHGLFLYPRADQPVGRSLDRYGDFAEAELGLLRQLVTPGGVVVDVGAHLGAVTVFLGKAVGAAGRVLAFEPRPALFQLLCGNLALNHLSQVEPFPQALDREAGEGTSFERAARLPAESTEVLARVGRKVPIASLDAFALPSCQLVRIEAAGKEADILAGAAQTLQRCQPTLCIVRERLPASRDWLGQLLAGGYRLYEYRPRLFNVDNFYRETDNIFGKTARLVILGLPAAKSRPVQGLREIRRPEDVASNR